MVMISSQPVVKHLSRQAVRSINSGKNSSSILQSGISIRENETAPTNQGLRTQTNRSSITIERRRKRPLFRRIYLFFAGAVLLVLILAAIGALILILIRRRSTDLTTSATSGTSVASTSGTSSTNVNASSTGTSSTTSTSSANLMLRWNSTGVTVAGVAGVASTAANNLDRPFSIALDSSNTLYIADQQNNRIQKWLMGASTGTTIAGQSSGGWGFSSSDFDQPSGVLQDSSGNIYVADTSNNCVQLWPNGASSGTTVAGIRSSAGSANNELADPYGIARDPNSGTLYIVDQSNHRVMSYLSGASSGTVVAGGNGQGTSNTQLFLPVGLCFDSSSNSLFIANAGANNVVRWILGATSWTLVAGSITGTQGSTSTLLNYPVGVTLDSIGNTYVADRNNHRVQLFLAGQSNGTTIAGVTGRSGSNSTLLFSPCSVALDAQLNLYVADTYNNRVQRFTHY